MAVGGYAHPRVLVEPEWLQAHVSDPSVRAVEADGHPESA